MLALALLAASASATELTHTGRLLDSAGEPIEGTVTITVALSSDEAGQVELYRESFTGVDVDGSRPVLHRDIFCSRSKRVWESA